MPEPWRGLRFGFVSGLLRFAQATQQVQMHCEAMQAPMPFPPQLITQ
jgi:hypothetical protein